MANRIDELRKKRGLTWEQLGNDLHMTKAVIWRFGTGKRELKQYDLQAISDYFGVTTDYLLGLPEKKKKDPIYIKVYEELKDLDEESQKDILNMVSKMKEIS